VIPENPPPLPDEDPNSLLPHYAAPAHNASEIVAADLIKIRPQQLSFSGYVSWAAVIGMTTLLFSVIGYSQIFTAPAVGGDANSLDLMQIQLQGKALVGQRCFLESQGQEIPESAKTVPPILDAGSYEQRLCYAILLSEIEGPSKALEYLESLDQTVVDSELELTDDQHRLREIIENVNHHYENGELEPNEIPVEDRELVERRLLWLGKLAFLPPGSPNKNERQELESEATSLMLVGGIGMMAGILFGLVGFALAVVFVVLLVTRKLQSGFHTRAYNHNIYIETFAIWMGLFFGSSILLGLIGIDDPQFGMLIQPFIFFGSLIAIAWPVIRGIPFAQVRRDIGWTTNNPAIEAASAIPTYLATLPFLIPGVILVSVLTSILAGFHEPHEFARQFAPSHPVQEYIASGGLTMILLIFLTACVAAPIVEETMFRGVLYRHLRDWSAGRQRWISIGFAAVVNGLIFASIHPQGIIGIPVLATLAIGFSLVREWRGSLFSSVVMHGIHNTVITCVSLLIL
jgi:membrane protease YdiL (CAAX protease family)